MRLNRLLAGVAAVAMATSAANAQTPQTPPPTGGPVEVEIDQGVLRPLQIAVVNFNGPNGSDVGGVIREDLRRTGYFQPLDPNSFVETGLTLANAPNFPQWTSIGAQAVHPDHGQGGVGGGFDFNRCFEGEAHCCSVRFC